MHKYYFALYLAQSFIVTSTVCEPVLEYEDTNLANVGVQEHKN